ncbi:YdeI/OmpD-associated family protein [Devosia sp.]|uniref:YdeI/OmpD-associated family protein n=1 Tax=Devosia sp. TaxID=1871048 RepID=UPI002EF80164
MAAVVPRPDRIREFRDRHAFEAWLAENHAREAEVWLKLHKKGSGLPSVTVAEALDVVLCWGWIDGIRKGLDANSFLQRYSPRGSKSIWSEINKAHVERLIREGRLQPPGLAQVEAAKSDGRWDRAYQGARQMEFPADLLAAIEKEPAARATFATLNSQNRYALAFRTHNMKTPAGRAKKIAAFVEMLKRGETIYPNGAGRRP